jgi:uncharacterized LabA/DUF88 family protein
MPESIIINQKVAILIDGNNIEISLHEKFKNPHMMLSFDWFIPRILKGRSLSRFVYFREGAHISKKLQERLHNNFGGSVNPCGKSADIPLAILAVQLAEKADTIIIVSGDSDYIELARYLKYRGVRVEIASITDSTSKVLAGEVDYCHVIEKSDCFVYKSNN